MNISTLKSNLDFFNNIYYHEEWKDEKCKNEILKAIEKCNEKIENAFGKSLHRLEKHKPAVEAVEKVVNKFPSTLLYENEAKDGQIPIHHEASHGSFEYIQVLVMEGIKYKVGAEDERGGLLIEDPNDHDEWNTLQMLSYYSYPDDDDDEDAKRLDVLKELRKIGLLVKQDIREHELLFTSCSKQSKKRFEYLVSWDPDALIDTRVDRKPFAHAIATSEQLPVFLESSFKYYPNKGGLLFLKDDAGNTAFDTMCDEIGAKETMKILYDLLTPKSDYPILHHVLVNAPQHEELFMEYFPWAYHLKDQNNRTLHQAVLAAGPDVMNLNKHLFASLSDNRIRKKDPLTTLYPFAAMAAGEHADLKKSFYLLRRHPSVLDRHARASTDRQSNSRRRKKRKRGDKNDA
ncbi:hypothetical protein CTEN210_00582 [Chaetoceros tenuissimus]|uniref:Ankyrin repeat protein n=1 Tax=Chaetoceros tenuissimus TaxID=426638 RepID=A0AAD3CDZ9_9STRA|nr:hypothetical protein CTEN210_00582 [Chaetoceros tenuissimus]